MVKEVSKHASCQIINPAEVAVALTAPTPLCAVITVVHVAVVIFIIIAGLTQVTPVAAPISLSLSALTNLPPPVLTSICPVWLRARQPALGISRVRCKDVPVHTAELLPT